MEIDDWRNRIDAMNDEIIALLNKRAVCAAEIGKLKKELRLPILDANREKAILEAVGEKAEKAGGPLTAESIKNIFQSIMEETRKVED